MMVKYNDTSTGRTSAKMPIMMKQGHLCEDDIDDADNWTVRTTSTAMALLLLQHLQMRLMAGRRQTLMMQFLMIVLKR